MELIPRCINGTTKNDAINKRLTNIDFIRNLPRENLAYNINECQLLFNCFENTNETISIQYPGKESHIRPWDFRPKLLLSNNTYLNDLSFGDIWDGLFNIYSDNTVNTNSKKHLLKLLACELYRIAFMIDYEYIPANRSYTLYYIQTGIEKKFISNYDFYIYKPNYKIIKELEKHYPTILDISWESFFVYNDLLAMNEDCKYFFNKLSENNDEKEAKSYIKGGTGRINTILTHIHILSVILGESSLTSLLKSFSNQRGVAPLTIEGCNNFLSEYMY
ncbi:hypothetical protein [Intestinibacter bartlettii]|uniref:hypothetical protein n=1 Tax=Intestinibacter bartlettii TaxID=261299 RepID=UPI003995332F